MESDPRRDRIVEARLAEVLARYGDRFDEEQQGTLREEIGKLYDAGEGLRQVRLTNADEPELIFHPRSEAS